MQTKLFPEVSSNVQKIVNVASVPQRSPFRYPGGKTWFVPQFRQWLASQQDKPSILLEPFAGGGIIGLTTAFEDLAEQVIMVEKDPDVSAVWHTITGKDYERLIKRILEFDLSLETAQEAIAQTPKTTEERAFQTILRNRTCHGGILAAGSGLLKNGENGKGIRSRWYPETLARRISQIALYAAPKIRFIEGDAFEVMESYHGLSECWMFIDPPYTAGGKRAGKRLYTHHALDHEKLFDLCQANKGLFLMTYDNAQEIKEMAFKRQFCCKEIPMKNTHHAEMTELVVGKAGDVFFATS
jgi:DNA adenine methylase